MRILFTSLSCLVDPGSGAAISVRTILKLLGERGHSVRAFSGGVFDRAQKPTSDEMLAWSGFRREQDPDLWQFEDGSLTHRAYSSGTHQVGRLDKESMVDALAHLQAEIKSFKPDVILSYGGTHFEKQARRLAKQAGILSAFYLAHPGYKKSEAFEDVDLVFTDSEATAALYRDRMALETTVIGKFVMRPNARRSQGGTRHVTFINPAHSKGVTLFYRIAEMMPSVASSLRFLVVESRASLDRVEESQGIPFSQMRNIRRIGLQADMSEVFSRTHALIMPSFWHESGGRSAIEALSLGIPVLCSNHGGLPEHLGDGALRFDIPQPLRENHRLIPPPSAALPWVSALARLWTDEDFWQERSRAALQAWEKHEPSSRVSLIEHTLEKHLEATQ